MSLEYFGLSERVGQGRRGSMSKIERQKRIEDQLSSAAGILMGIIFMAKIDRKMFENRSQMEKILLYIECSPLISCGMTSRSDRLRALIDDSCGNSMSVQEGRHLQLVSVSWASSKPVSSTMMIASSTHLAFSGAQIGMLSGFRGM